MIHLASPDVQPPRRWLDGAGWPTVILVGIGAVVYTALLMPGIVAGGLFRLLITGFGIGNDAARDLHESFLELVDDDPARYSIRDGNGVDFSDD